MGDPITMGLLLGGVMGAGKTVNDAATAQGVKEDNTVSNKWAPLLALNGSKGAPLRAVPHQNPLGNIFSGLLGGAAFGQSNPGDILGGGGGGGEKFGPAYARGGMIPGVAKFPGNSFKNDKVPLWGSPGEVIVPRSVMKNPKQKVAAYLNAVKKHGPGPLPGRGVPAKISPWGAMACGGMVGKK